MQLAATKGVRVLRPEPLSVRATREVIARGSERGAGPRVRASLPRRHRRQSAAAARAARDRTLRGSRARCREHPERPRACGRQPAHRGARASRAARAGCSRSSPAPWRCSETTASCATRASSPAIDRDAAIAALRSLIAVGVLADRQPLAFEHPLLRTAVTSTFPRRCARPSTVARRSCSPARTRRRRPWRTTCCWPSRWARRGRSARCASRRAPRPSAACPSRPPRTCAARSTSRRSRSCGPSSLARSETHSCGRAIPKGSRCCSRRSRWPRVPRPARRSSRRASIRCSAPGAPRRRARCSWARSPTREGDRPRDGPALHGPARDGARPQRRDRRWPDRRAARDWLAQLDATTSERRYAAGVLAFLEAVYDGTAAGVSELARRRDRQRGEPQGRRASQVDRCTSGGSRSRSRASPRRRCAGSSRRSTSHAAAAR